MLRPALLLSLLMLALPMRAQAEDDRPLVRFRMEQLQQTVGLPEDQARAVVERWSRYDREQFDKTQQIQQIRRKFNDILMGPGSEEEKNARVRPLLEQFVDLRRQQADLKFKFEEDIRARLSPAQQVRLITHVEEMQRRMVEAIRQQRLGHGAEPGMRPGAGIRRGGRR